MVSVRWSGQYDGECCLGHGAGQEAHLVMAHSQPRQGSVYSMLYPKIHLVLVCFAWLDGHNRPFAAKALNDFGPDHPLLSVRAREYH
jgi:hypothetical protein